MKHRATANRAQWCIPGAVELEKQAQQVRLFQQVPKPDVPRQRGRGHRSSCLKVNAQSQLVLLQLRRQAEMYDAEASAAMKNMKLMTPPAHAHAPSTPSAVSLDTPEKKKDEAQRRSSMLQYRQRIEGQRAASRKRDAEMQRRVEEHHIVQEMVDSYFPGKAGTIVTYYVDPHRHQPGLQCRALM